MDAGRFVAEHIKPIGSSGIRRVFELGETLKDPINLSIGQPDYPVPEPVKEAMIRAIREDRNGYTVTGGIPELRERIGQQLREEFGPGLGGGVDWNPGVLVTSGLSGGLLLALQACLNPRDEVLMGDPYFVSYPHLTRLVGGVPVSVDLYDDFRLIPERFEAAITPRSKILLLCSPSNPTGVVYREQDMAAMAELARRHDLLIISDEIYCTLSYDGAAPSPVRFAPERTILLRGFGKSHAMTGLRLGFAAGPEEIISEMSKLQQYTFVCAPHPVQYGGLAAMDVDMSAHVADYGRKRNLACSELDGAFEYVRPSGGFYIYPKVPPGFAGASEFADRALESNVLIIPGEVFSGRDTHFRISYAAPDDTIRKGCRALRNLARSKQRAEPA